ncbi:MAG: type II toxin-antitoxin system VapC family toxin [Giesbergeria sp.]
MQLADTNVISELMRRQPNAGALAWRDMTDAMHGGVIISAISVDEIFYGLLRKPNAALLAWFDGFIGRNQVLDATAAIARRAGEMRGMLAARGQVRSQADMLIAATAQVHALTLVTRNVRDFDGCGIAVLNPFTP